jgi:hypothetical protein
MWGPCEGEVLPAAVETCNAEDDDCDGGVDEDFGDVQCGVGICQVTAEECVDGQMMECVPGDPDPAETCNGLDDTCDGEIDEGCSCINGNTQPCYSGPANTEGVGICIAGTQTCVDGSWGACEDDVVPATETCDGEDDDCDGSIDDGDPGGGNGCQTGLPGLCSTGQTQCNGGMIECIQTVFPQAETCDGLDNDCDTGVDEGNPGGGQACSTGLPGVCDAGETLCQAGNLSCQQTVFGSPESCDGLDNDCDGATDENNPEGGQACNTGMPGVCGNGITACQGGALACQQQTMASNEVCDGLDNDCDGMTDEGNPGSGAMCNTGQPGVCAQGTTACQGGALVCNPNTMASNETCDGLDNDCDGFTDEGNPGGGAVCSTGQPGVCSAGTTVCQGGNLVCNADNSPGAEQCDNLDNDCDGATDEGDPGGGVMCNTGLLGVCAAGTTQCTGGMIECAQNTASGPEVCGDGLDNDCNGTVDNGCCSQAVGDGGFEGGTPNTTWTETSTNFGTPLCSVASCPSGGGSGPHGGTWWAWFGGFDGYELGVLSQSITIPSGTATLTFWLEIPACADSGVDTFDMTIDGVSVFATDNADAVCDTVGYVQHSVDVSAFADGGVHTLEMVGEVFGMGPAQNSITNFFIDDLSIQSCI